jgi:cell division septum initiation protein DivIVA
VEAADVEIAGNDVAEGYVEAILDPETRIERLRAELAEAEAAEASASAPRVGAEAAEASASVPRVGAEAAEASASAPRAGAAADAASQGPARADALRARIASIESRIGEVDRDSRMRILRKRRELLRDGVPVETFRRISLDEALGRLGSKTPVAAG